MKVGVFHPGTQHSWQTALAFQEAGTLAWFATSIFYDPAQWPYKLERFTPEAVSRRLNLEFSRRHHPALNPNKVRHCGLWEWTETLLRRSGQFHWARLCNELGNRAFCRQIIRLVEREPVDVLWGFDTSSLEVFMWARKRGIYCVLDQTIGHPVAQNREMLREQERHPEFFERSYQPHSKDWIDRQNAEIENADLVLVGSDYCARTIVENGCPPEKIRIVPYGYDADSFAALVPKPALATQEPVRCLFVGEIGPRKGAAYLLQAFAELPPEQVQLTLVGRLAIPTSTFSSYQERVKHIPQVPRHEVLKYFREADCFVFPSLFEGSAMVLYEACGAELGIIATDRCGDGLRAGRNGLALSQLSVENLIAAIEQVVGSHELLKRWQQSSRACRSERTWQSYRNKVSRLFSDD
jgi:glycosyltransferase involved in cell wall biosynthesis